VGTESIATGSDLQGLHGIASFDPLMDGIMAGPAERRRRR
jgi:hypothetical protein